MLPGRFRRKKLNTRWKLAKLLKENKLSVRKVMLESGLGSNTIYPIARGTATQISTQTIIKLLETLSWMLKRDVGLDEVFEVEQLHKSKVIDHA